MHKILLIQTAFIGDVILATALLEALHEQYPKARIDFLLRSGNQGLLEGHPFVGQTLTWNKKEKKYASLWHLLRSVRAEQYDLVVNLQRFFSTGFLTAFSGAKETIGFDKNPWSFFFKRRVVHPIGAAHEIDRNLDLIRHLLREDRRYLPRLYPPAAAFEKVKKEEAYICLAPTSVWFTKQWPASSWVGLIDLLPRRYGIYLLGGPADREACEQIRQASKRPDIRNTAGELSFLESAALISRAQMNYVNDSAPLHMASAMNAPVTAVFCSTIPEFGFGPLSDASRVMETLHPLDCRPCGLHGKKACPKGHFRCSEISPTRLFDILE